MGQCQGVEDREERIVEAVEDINADIKRLLVDIGELRELLDELLFQLTNYDGRTIGLVNRPLP